ncbi:hypothetical protein AB0V79_32275 [Mesorhizobium ciceri]|uniref:hypothetical protein n=1 Tax=Mesorhizobium TaxID=68287 RepID=UPI0004BB709C
MILKSDVASALPSWAQQGEAAHKLKGAVLFHERGEIRDRSFESQALRASGPR